MSDDGLKKLHAGTWCAECGREWTGLSECHCASCHCHFTSESAFDRHLANPNALENCHDPAHILDNNKRKVFEHVQRIHGPVWRLRKFTPHYRSDLAASSNPSFSDGSNGREAGDGSTEPSGADGKAQTGSR